MRFDWRGHDVISILEPRRLCAAARRQGRTPAACPGGAPGGATLDSGTPRDHTSDGERVLAEERAHYRRKWMPVSVTGSGLTIEDVVAVARAGEPVSLHPDAM